MLVRKKKLNLLTLMKTDEKVMSYEEAVTNERSNSIVTSEYRSITNLH